MNTFARLSVFAAVFAAGVGVGVLSRQQSRQPPPLRFDGDVHVFSGSQGQERGTTYRPYSYSIDGTVATVGEYPGDAADRWHLFLGRVRIDCVRLTATP